MHVYPHYSFQLGRFSNLSIWAQGGEGYAIFTAQTTNPTTPPAGYVKLFSDSTVSNIARLSMITSSGAVLTFFRDAVDTIRNNSGGALTKGQVVYKNGANGITATVALAKADAFATACGVGLILSPSLANNSFGTIITHGRFQGVDTTAFAQGDTVYVSPTVAGALTNVRPVSPYLDVKVGTVVTSSANGIVDLTFQPYVPRPTEDSNEILTIQSFAKPGFTGYFTGPITALGGVTAVASQTGNGTKFVMDTAPTFASTIKVTTGASVGGATPGAGGVAFPATAVAVADVNTLDDYEEYTAASTACTGALTVSVIWKATKVGNKITLTLPATSGSAAAASTIVYGVALPADFSPAASIAFAVLVRDNGTNQTTPGMIIINTSGVITIYKDATGASFTNASTCGLAQSIGTGLSWTI